MFDANFYAQVLPQLVQAQCTRQPDKTPVVLFQLGDGTVLDVCHIAQLADKWITVAHFRDPETCDDMDFCFLPYELVTRVSLSLHQQQARKLGFRIENAARADE